MTQSNHSSDERYGEQAVQSHVEDVPESNIVPPYFPKFGDLVTYKAKSHDVQDALDDHV
jgi:hypothetical protein